MHEFFTVAAAALLMAVATLSHTTAKTLDQAISDGLVARYRVLADPGGALPRCSLIVPVQSPSSFLVCQREIQWRQATEDRGLHGIQWTKACSEEFHEPMPPRFYRIHTVCAWQLGRQSIRLNPLTFEFKR